MRVIQIFIFYQNELFYHTTKSLHASSIHSHRNNSYSFLSCNNHSHCETVCQENFDRGLHTGASIIYTSLHKALIKKIYNLWRNSSQQTYTTPNKLLSSTNWCNFIISIHQSQRNSYHNQQHCIRCV